MCQADIALRKRRFAVASAGVARDPDGSSGRHPPIVVDSRVRIFAQVGTRCRLGGWRAGAPVLVMLVGLMWSTVLVAPA